MSLDPREADITGAHYLGVARRSSDRVGYEDPTVFRRIFKRRTGVTSARYRQRFQSIGTLQRGQGTDDPERGIAMTRNDALGLPMRGAGATAADLYHQALHELQCYRGDPLATAEQALSRSPDFVMARVLHAYLHLPGIEPDGFAVARTDLETAETLPSTARERAHLSVVKHLPASEWHVASRIPEDIAIQHPHDTLALQVGHVVDCCTGASRLP